MEKKCLFCKRSISGRSDKKYCSDQCRNNFNNKVNRQKLPYVRKINKALLKNRSILENFKPNGNTVISKEKLLIRGFNFNLFTHTTKEKSGKKSYFCYEFGYTSMGENRIKLLKLKSKKDLTDPFDL